MPSVPPASACERLQTERTDELITDGTDTTGVADTTDVIDGTDTTDKPVASLG